MLLQVENVSKSFHRGQQVLQHVNVYIGHGEIVGLVGESGSGKSTLAKIIMQLEKANQGHIHLNGKPITKKNCQSLYEHCQLIFQNATAALNPMWTVRESLLEPLQHKQSVSNDYLHIMLKKVKLPISVLSCLPNELSGGERQRVNLLRSILVEPKLLVCDEIVSSLDRLIQREIIDLLISLNKEQNMAILFISHDLKAVTYLCERVYVMKDGVIVDESKKEQGVFRLTNNYAQKLFQAMG
ncbi:ABC transporter ATP-binding protein [Lysinibacillus fusiformis]|nr:ABC transporter ATP-binding protein [Lysinibacillus fusiformis]